MSVARAQHEISAKEFGEWLAYGQISPGEPERSDLQMALVCRVLVSMFGSKKIQDKVTLQDFVLKFDSAPQEEKNKYDDKTLENRNRFIARMILGV